MVNIDSIFYLFFFLFPWEGATDRPAPPNDAAASQHQLRSCEVRQPDNQSNNSELSSLSKYDTPLKLPSLGGRELPSDVKSAVHDLVLLESGWQPSGSEK